MPAAASSMRNAGESREDLTTAPGNPTTSDRDTGTSDGRTLLRHPGKTILVFSLVLAPLAIVPYVLVRRQVLGLRKEIADLRKVNGVAIKEMNMCTQEMSQQRAAAIEKAVEMQKKNRTILSAVKSEVEASRKAVEESGVRLENIENDLSELSEAVEDMNREAAIRASDHKNMLSVANTVAKEREARAQAWRNWMITTMREEKQRRDDTSAALGGSLADIAAFMQEVEIRQGWTPRPDVDDGRGIERARQLAKRLLDETATAKQHMEETNGTSAEATEKESIHENESRP
ncbi:hypothetical protein K466DRAFT_287002 [Polyporus arcularius HHB13444]|uniref:Uncharacterized protein n=1 Tax=Polyporus arcularius HHB13444 TaxID=1314778 RepID=A0A5C3PPX6_9APHY|nr:hypothetical protein K466DRAFT_287002 [Polyporus arcularius HHB13444]